MNLLNLLNQKIDPESSQYYIALIFLVAGFVLNAVVVLAGIFMICYLKSHGN